ncbi:hypothetical protein SLS60_008366 [Paraconiothyrium brasiliense]|uniref:Uncharacterized protein n=1 Tax=Paraconiothyrium brasiliense TaxID=300254 RepID=A0ABR3R0E0_9PLEO
MQRCQRGGQDGYSFIEADDFEALYKSLVGRFEIMERFAKRFHGDSRRSRAAYKQKIQKKRDHTEFVYECGESALRNSVNEDGEELDSWRTPGNVGKAARNLFPVVNEDFDPFIIMEGPQTQLFTAPTPLTSNSGSTSTTSNDIAVQSFAPAQYEPEILPTDATPRAIFLAEAFSGPLSQADTKTPVIDAIKMPASDLTQVQKCIFCTTDPQGTHKRFDKIEKAGKIKCNKSGHDIFTCGRCTSNYHPVAETTPQLQAHALPRIILTSPNSKHSSVLESFASNKTALYPPAKKRGRANWMAYKWMPKVRELVDEKTMQFTKARNRSLRRESQRYGAVQHLATSALASTPITFFGPGSKPTAELDLVAQAMASTYASPIATASTGPSTPPKGTFSPSNLPKSKHNSARDLNDFRSNRSYSEVARHGGDTVNNFQYVASQELQYYLSEKASHVIVQKSDCTDTLRADDSDAKKTKPKLPVTFSSCTSAPELIITFGTRARSDRSIPSGKASIIHLANGSPSHRPSFSPSVYTLIFTTASEICENEEPGSPTSPPPSPTWSTASTDSSCISEIETHAGWETLAKEYDDALGGLC